MKFWIQVINAAEDTFLAISLKLVLSWSWCILSFPKRIDWSWRNLIKFATQSIISKENQLIVFYKDDVCSSTWITNRMDCRICFSFYQFLSEFLVTSVYPDWDQTSCDFIFLHPSTCCYLLLWLFFGMVRLERDLSKSL